MRGLWCLRPKETGLRMAMQQVQVRVTEIQQQLYFINVIKKLITAGIPPYIQSRYYYFTERQSDIYMALFSRIYGKTLIMSRWNTSNYAPIDLFYKQLSATYHYYTYQYKCE